MKTQEIRHCRVVELRNMALRGAKMEQLKARCVQWKISSSTMRNYIDEVVSSLQKANDKQS